MTNKLHFNLNSQNIFEPEVFFFISSQNIIALKSALLGKNNFDFIKTIAADLDYDGILTMADYTKLKSYILGEINSLNR